MNGRSAVGSTQSPFARRIGAILINVEIHDEAGCFIATSPQFPEICVVHENLGLIFADMPKIIEAICLDRYGVKVMVLPADNPDEQANDEHTYWPWVAIPAHIAAQAVQ